MRDSRKHRFSYGVERTSPCHYDGHQNKAITRTDQRIQSARGLTFNPTSFGALPPALCYPAVRTAPIVALSTPTSPPRPVSRQDSGTCARGTPSAGAALNALAPERRKFTQMCTWLKADMGVVEGSVGDARRQRGRLMAERETERRSKKEMRSTAIPASSALP